MILTTSRDPSQRTRSLAKVLSRFMNWKYVQRGKLSLENILDENEKVFLIREIKGNPAFLDIYQEGKNALTLRINVGVIRKEKMDDSPVYFTGSPPFDPSLLGALPKTRAGEKLARKLDFRKVVYYSRDGRMTFKFDGKEVLTVKLLGVYEGTN